MKPRHIIAALSLTAVLGAGYAYAQMTHDGLMDHDSTGHTMMDHDEMTHDSTNHDTMDHNSMDQGTMASTMMDHNMSDADSHGLTEPGQGAFGALSEIVQTLEADPDTNWAQVDITALRDHLIDMDRVVRDTVVTHETLDNGLRAVVTGDADTLAAAQRMVPAHAAQLAVDTRWNVETSSDTTSVTLIVTSDDPATATRIIALGFYGLMASQDHHRAHHYMMATGEDAHTMH